IRRYITRAPKAYLNNTTVLNATSTLSLHDALPILHYDPTSSKSSILENCQPSTVFNDLEIPIVNKSKIIVEDKAAELLLKMIARSEEHTSELQSRFDIVCRLLLEI